MENGLCIRIYSNACAILAVWKEEGWIESKLVENTSLNQVTLELQMKKETRTIVFTGLLKINVNREMVIDNEKIRKVESDF